MTSILGQILTQNSSTVITYFAYLDIDVNANTDAHGLAVMSAQHCIFYSQRHRFSTKYWGKAAQK